MPKKEFKSCYQCVALYDCFPFKRLGRVEARELAASCTKPYKGLATDTICVEGRSKGMSRKKAYKFNKNNKACWTGKDKVKIFTKEEAK